MLLALVERIACSQKSKLSMKPLALNKDAAWIQDTGELNLGTAASRINNSALLPNSGTHTRRIPFLLFNCELYLPGDVQLSN